jgi:hypothetical protein
MLFVGDGKKHQPQHICHKMKQWKGIEEKTGGVNGMKAYITNDKASH